jgi:hypothetical protein
MKDEILTLAGRTIRVTDSNSLLRLYDQANSIFHHSLLQQERQRADRTIQLIAQELRKRNVTF